MGRKQGRQTHCTNGLTVAKPSPPEAAPLEPVATLSCLLGAGARGGAVCILTRLGGPFLFACDATTLRRDRARLYVVSWTPVEEAPPSWPPRSSQSSTSPLLPVERGLSTESRCSRKPVSLEFPRLLLALLRSILAFETAVEVIAFACSRNVRLLANRDNYKTHTGVPWTQPRAATAPKTPLQTGHLRPQR